MAGGRRRFGERHNGTPNSPNRSPSASGCRGITDVHQGLWAQPSGSPLRLHGPGSSVRHRSAGDDGGRHRDGCSPSRRVVRHTREHAVVVPLRDLGAGDLPLAGGKAANLGELIRRGTAGAGRLLRDDRRLRATSPTRAGLADVSTSSRAARPATRPVGASSPAARASGSGPHRCPRTWPRPSPPRTAPWASDAPVAVRSSATAEDLPVRQLRRPAGHLPQRRRRGRRAGRGPPLLGLAVDRPRRRLPRAQRHRPPRGRGSPSSCSGWSTPRSPGCCSPPTR